MFNEITIEPIKAEYAHQLHYLWRTQFSYFCSDTDIYLPWEDYMRDIFTFIELHAKSGDGVVAKLKGEVAGFLAYDIFKFHGAKSAFIPFVGNAAALESRDDIYAAMYAEVARIWADKGIKSHYITIPAADSALKDNLFGIGFGAYVIDAYASLKPQIADFDDDIAVLPAQAEDAEALCALVDESADYYASSPIFLTRESYSLSEITRLIENSHIFLAKDGEELVGFINLSVSGRTNLFDMTLKGFGMIDEIGAYITKDYRSRNIGRRFIAAIAAYCAQNKIPCVHVDYETANPCARHFWPKYFTPVKLSLKRTLHADI